MRLVNNWMSWVSVEICEMERNILLCAVTLFLPDPSIPMKTSIFFPNNEHQFLIGCAAVKRNRSIYLFLIKMLSVNACERREWKNSAKIKHGKTFFDFDIMRV